MIPPKHLSAVVAMFLLANATSFGVTVSLSNTGAAGTRPIGNADASPIPAGTGRIQLGTVSNPAAFDAAAMGLAGDPSPANFAAVLSDFTAFASGAFQGVAGDPPSLFDIGGQSVAVAPGGPLDGAPVYLVVSLHPFPPECGVLIYKTESVLPNDSDPTAALDFRLATDSGSALFGVTNGNVDFGGGAMLPGTLLGRFLIPHPQCIPEPSVSLLALFSAGIVFLLRRRRQQR